MKFININLFFYFMQFFDAKNLLDFVAFLTTTLYLSCSTYFTDPSPPPSTSFHIWDHCLRKFIFSSFFLHPLLGLIRNPQQLNFYFSFYFLNKRDNPKTLKYFLKFINIIPNFFSPVYDIFDCSNTLK